MSASRCLIALLTGLVVAAAAPAETVRGVVTRVDPDKKQLVLEGRGLGRRGAVLVFSLAPDVQVTFGDQPAALADVEVGRRVRVEFEADGDRQIILSIQVLGGPRPAVTAPGTSLPAANGNVLTGVLRRVGYSDREVVLVGPGAAGPETETTAAVPETSKIVKNGKEATLDDLKEGDAATVQVEKKDGRTVALSVQVGPGAAPATGDRPASKMIPKLRILLKIADQVLQNMEDRDRQP